MKKLWARIGMSVNITDEEHATIKTLLSEGKEEEARVILARLFINKGYYNGDSYMPGNYIGGCEDNPNEDVFDL